MQKYQKFNSTMNVTTTTLTSATVAHTHRAEQAQWNQARLQHSPTGLSSPNKNNVKNNEPSLKKEILEIISLKDCEI